MEITIFLTTQEATLWSKYGTQFVSLVGILISAGIAIYLFNRGLQMERDRFEHNRLVEKHDKAEIKKNELQDLKNHLITLLKGTIRAVTKQFEEYLNKAFDIINQPYNRLVIANYTHENLKRIIQIDSHQLWEIFEEYKIDTKHFTNLYACLDYFDNVFIKVQEDVYEGNGQVVNDLMNNIIKIRNNILNVITNYIYLEKGRNTEFQSNPYWNMLNQVVFEYHQDNDGIPNIKRDYDMLINRLKPLLLAEQYRYFPLSNKILNLCKEGGDTFFSINQINRDLATDIITASEYIQDMNIKLEEILTELEKQTRTANG